MPRKGCRVGRVAKLGRVRFPAGRMNHNHVYYIGNLSKAKSRTPPENKWECCFPLQVGRRDIIAKHIEKQQEGHRGKYKEVERGRKVRVQLVGTSYQKQTQDQ